MGNFASKNTQLDVTNGAAHVAIKTNDTSALAISAIALAATTLVYTTTADANKLSQTIGAAAGDVIRLYCPSDASIGWGSTEVEAESNSVLPTAKLAGDGMYFAAGTEYLKVPASLTGDIWLAIDAVTDTGAANIVLMA